ncbi:MAG TPA: trehalase family glycosidase [Candidatus Nanopelagicaceae bacterium]|nr:trehalase family glycosidase [Candidatus Nanopelagicaceae bacterium]
MTEPVWEWGEQRAWNTWEARYPACYVHRPSGLAIKLMAFSTATGAGSTFPVGSGTRFGQHSLDGSQVEIGLSHDGSDLLLRFWGHGASGMHGRVQVRRTAEWGLRFWYLLAVGFLGDDSDAVTLSPLEEAVRYTEAPIASARRAGVHAEFQTLVRPVGASLYDDWQQASRDLEDAGYYYRPPQRQRGNWAVYRFNATEPEVDFVVGMGSSTVEARSRLVALRSTVGTEPPVDGSAAAGRTPAVTDIVGWNTVWDQVNWRPYTVVTRNWVDQRFGGWIVWQLDTFLSALLAAHAGDTVIARANVDAALAGATPAGNLAGLMSAHSEWVDRSHPPLGAHVVWNLFLRTADRAILDQAFPLLFRAAHWWFDHRDGNGNGLLEYGSSPVGDGHFVHTKLAAMDESANDNSPVHDEASFDTSTHTLDMEDVGLNSLLVHEMELLGRMAEVLGRVPEAAWLKGRVAGLGELVREQLWDSSRGVFANRLWDGRFARSLSPASFFPLLAGIATPAQAETMVREHLLNPEAFWGPFPVAGTPHSDPAAADNVYWRGRVWPYFNYVVYQGLRRNRFDAVATALAEAGAAMFERGWSERFSYENYDQRTGEGGSSVDAEAFYTWGALLPMLAEVDVVGLDAWDGITFGREKAGRACMWTSQGSLEVEIAEAGVRLAIGSRAVVETPARVRFRGLEMNSPESLSFQVPASPDPMTFNIWISNRMVRAWLDGEPLMSSRAGGAAHEGWATVEVPAADTERLLELAAGEDAAEFR